MPTGYTDSILKKPNMAFPEFALLCARAFGALIDLRDEPLSTPIPTEIQPSDYHKKALKSAFGAKGRFKQLTRAQKRNMATAAMLKDMKYHVEAYRTAERQEAAYRRMLAEVEAWVPPTADHEGLKKFMVEQITGSLEHDCTWARKYHTDALREYVALQPKTWLKHRRESMERDVKYHSEENAKEVARCSDRTGWIRDLMRSLGVNTVPTPDAKGYAFDTKQLDKKPSLT